MTGKKAVPLVLALASLLFAGCSELTPSTPQVELLVTPTSAPVQVAGVSNYQVGTVAVRLSGANNPIDVGISLVSPPSGVTLISPTTLQASNTPASQPLVLRVDPSTLFSPGENQKPVSLTLKATPQGQGLAPTQKTVNVTFVNATSSTQPLAYTLSASLNPTSVAPGGSATLTAQLTRTSGQGSQGTVQVSVTTPAGSPLTVSPTTQQATLSDSNPSATLSFTVSAAANAAPESYTLTVTATGGNAPAPQTVTLSVVDTTPKATIRLGASSISITQGQSASLAGTVSVSNYDGGVSLEVTGLPAGVTVDPIPPFPASSSYPFTLTFRAANNAQVGTYALTLSAKTESGAVLGTANLSLVVAPMPMLTAGVTLDRVTAQDGDTVLGQVQVGSQGFSGQVTVSVSACAYNVRYLSSNTLNLFPSNPSGTVSFAVDVPVGAPGGTCQVTATAQGGTLSTTATATFTVNPRPQVQVSTFTPVVVNNVIAFGTSMRFLGSWQGIAKVSLLDGNLNPISVDNAQPLYWKLNLSGVTLAKNTTTNEYSFYVDSMQNTVDLSGSINIVAANNWATGTYTFYLVVQGPNTKVAPVTVTVE
jgi:hypothetical protein